MLKIPMSVEKLLKSSPQCSALIEAHHQDQKNIEAKDLDESREKLNHLLKKIAIKPSKTSSTAKERLEKKISKLELKIKKHSSEKLHDYDYRIYPLFYAPIVVQGPNGEPILKPMRFQCLPQGKDEQYDKKHSLYKAKKESLTEKYFERIRKNSASPSVWEPLFGSKHGILILNGFFEFNKIKKTVGFQTKKGDFMLVPCIYDQWTSKDGQQDFESFAVITEKSSTVVEESGYHRSPVILKERHFSSWLNPKGLSNEELHNILEDKIQDPYIPIAS